MICDKEVLRFHRFPTKLKIAKLVEAYRRDKSWDGRVFVALNFSEIFTGDKN